MNILAVDDERIMLNELTTELSKVFPDTHIQGEMSPFSAAQWVEELAVKGEKLDYAFLDIRMSGMSGLELARRIKTVFPNTVLIFCTAYTEYAFDAVGMFAKGYLVKPISAENIIQTLDEMVYDWRRMKSGKPREICVQTFGHFDVFVDGQPVMFEREKAKELFAYLVDRHGATITTEQIANLLWEDKPYDRKLKNYATTILASLKSSLRAVGIEDILIKTHNHLAVDVNKIKCDAYEYEKGNAVAINSFRGEYMVNYSWAEFTTGRYANMTQE